MVVPDPTIQFEDSLVSKAGDKLTCLGAYQRKSEFENLVDKIRSALGPSSGIDSNDVDCEHLINLMRMYNSKEDGWGKYALVDPSRNYTRNFVDHGNGKANLLVLVWNPGKGSLIHDHADAHCIMKVCPSSGTNHV
jgi:cysteine dioxygenase